MNRQVKSQIRLGVSLLCWKIWNCHDYIVLEKVNVSSFAQVMHMAIHFIPVRGASFIVQKPRIF